MFQYMPPLNITIPITDVGHQRKLEDMEYIRACDADIMQTYPIGRIGDPLQICLLCLGVQQNH